MAWVYGNRDVEKGDIVEFIGDHSSFTKGQLYVVTGFWNDSDILVHMDNHGSNTNGMGKKHWRLVKTKPGKEAKPGDKVIHIAKGSTVNINGELVLDVGFIHTAQPSTDSRFMYWSAECPTYNQGTDHFLVLCTDVLKFNPKILNEKITVNCRTQEQATIFLGWAHENGKTWCGSLTYVFNDNWEDYKEGTVYTIFEGIYNRIEYYNSKNVNIWSYEDALCMNM